MRELKFSICLTTYNAAFLINRTLGDILNQTFKNYEVIISDNASTDNTQKVVENFGDARFKYFRNAANIGYTANLNLCLQRAKGDIIFLMSPKSRISSDTLEQTHKAFLLSEDVGAVTRPYYWFGDNLNQVVRAKNRFAQKDDLMVSVHDDPQIIIEVFKTVDNPAGLAFRKKYLDIPFHQDKFVEFIYPFASILKKHKVVLLKNYTMACPAWEYSGSQDHEVYRKSPTQSWVDMLDTVFCEPEFKMLKEHCIRNFVMVNYVGLAQVKNYGGFKCLLREIFQLTKYRKANLLNAKFWIFSAGAFLIPSFLLKRLVVFFKRGINTKVIKNIRLGE